MRNAARLLGINRQTSPTQPLEDVKIRHELPLHSVGGSREGASDTRGRKPVMCLGGCVGCE